MEYRAVQEGRIKASIFLQVSSEVLQFDDVRFSADVANKSGVAIHSIDEARKMIDFEVAYTQTDWRNPEVKQRLDQCEKCEILVLDFIPIELIRNIPDG